MKQPKQEIDTLKINSDAQTLQNDRGQHLGLFRVCWFNPVTLSQEPPVMVLAESPEGAISQAGGMFRKIEELLTPLESMAVTEWSTVTEEPFLIRGWGKRLFRTPQQKIEKEITE